MPVHSYIGDLFAEEAPESLEQYGLAAFLMKVQGSDRTLVDKVFAICDYYMNGNVKGHSRHIYDIYKLLPLTVQDESFRTLVKKVRAVRAKTKVCPSAMPGINVTKLLSEIVIKDIYKEDYNVLTSKLLEEKISYEDALTSVKSIADSRIFDE